MTDVRLRLTFGDDATRAQAAAQLEAAYRAAYGGFTSDGQTTTFHFDGPAPADLAATLAGYAAADDAAASLLVALPTLELPELEPLEPAVVVDPVPEPPVAVDPASVITSATVGQTATPEAAT